MAEPGTITTVYVQACDLSQNRPGFALLQYSTFGKAVRILRKSNINNKAARDKSHGQKLSEIAHELKDYMMQEPLSKLVREEAQNMYAQSHTQAKTQVALSKVVGVSDLVGWNLRGQIFEEVGAKAVKKQVANNSEATKEEVAAALVQFVGEQDYDCDDESDAVAVGIAWLIQNGFVESPYKEAEEAPPPKKTRGRKKKAE